MFNIILLIAKKHFFFFCNKNRHGQKRNSIFGGKRIGPKNRMFVMLTSFERFERLKLREKNTTRNNISRSEPRLNFIRLY